MKKPAASAAATAQTAPMKTPAAANIDTAVKDDLKFRAAWHTKSGYDGPRYYKNCTIYCDVVNGIWRVKPNRGSRKTAMIKWGSGGATHREQWAKVVEQVHRDVREFKP
jgi:hypothetical protein